MFLSFRVKDVNDVKEYLQEDLNQVAKCCSELHLLINPKKTKYPIIGTRQLLQNLPSDMSLNFLGEVIRPIPSAKDLEITMDTYMTYNYHITELVFSCMSKLSQINQVSKCFDKETISILISALAMNKLLYCSSAWSNTTIKNINKLQSVQNFACRIMTSTKKFDHISPKLQELNWLPVKEQLLFRDTFRMYNAFMTSPHPTSEIYLQSVPIYVNDAFEIESSSKYLCITQLPQVREYFIIEG